MPCDTAPVTLHTAHRAHKPPRQAPPRPRICSQKGVLTEVRPVAAGGSRPVITNVGCFHCVSSRWWPTPTGLRGRSRCLVCSTEGRRECLGGELGMAWGILFLNSPLPDDMQSTACVWGGGGQAGRKEAAVTISGCGPAGPPRCVGSQAPQTGEGGASGKAQAQGACGRPAVWPASRGWAAFPSRAGEGPAAHSLPPRAVLHALTSLPVQATVVSAPRGHRRFPEGLFPPVPPGPASPRSRAAWVFHQPPWFPDGCEGSGLHHRCQ